MTITLSCTHTENITFETKQSVLKIHKHAHTYVHGEFLKPLGSESSLLRVCPDVPLLSVHYDFTVWVEPPCSHNKTNTFTSTACMYRHTSNATHDYRVSRRILGLGGGKTTEWVWMLLTNEARFTPIGVSIPHTKARFTPIGVSIPHTKARFTPLGVNIQAATFWLQPLRFGIAERGKFDNVSYTPLAVAI